MGLKETEWEIEKGAGKCRVSLKVINTGRGIQALLTGGDSPHIGGVVMAVPRQSLDKNKKELSADYYIMPVPGHKDVEVARLAAESLFKEYQTVVTVSAGIHSDDLSSEEIKQIIEHCRECTTFGH